MKDSEVRPNVLECVDTPRSMIVMVSEEAGDLLVS
jgi:hypothetical protein